MTFSIRKTLGGIEVVGIDSDYEIINIGQTGSMIMVITSVTAAVFEEK